MSSKNNLSPLEGENRLGLATCCLASLREGYAELCFARGKASHPLTQLQLGNKLPSLRNPLPQGERGGKRREVHARNYR
jgi:hypothetical protein